MTCRIQATKTAASKAPSKLLSEFVSLSSSVFADLTAHSSPNAATTFDGLTRTRGQGLQTSSPDPWHSVRRWHSQTCERVTDRGPGSITHSQVPKSELYRGPVFSQIVGTESNLSQQKFCYQKKFCSRSRSSPARPRLADDDDDHEGLTLELQNNYLHTTTHNFPQHPYHHSGS